MAYFANSTEGNALEQQCERCPIGEKTCPILHVQLFYNYVQIGNDLLKSAMNVLVNEKGKCMMKPLIDEVAAKKKDDDHASLFDRSQDAK